jgi:hypothetical protein
MVEEPDPPEGVPDYVTEPIQRQDLESLNRIRNYLDRLIDARERGPDVEEELEEGEKLVEKEEGDGYTRVVKKVKCGKNCSGCPHGPYEYHVTWDGKKTNWEYIGKVGEES